LPDLLPRGLLLPDGRSAGLGVVKMIFEIAALKSILITLPWIKEIESREESREQRAESREQRAEIREQRAESREQRSERSEQRAESR
jgi:hypothetical protein